MALARWLERAAGRLGLPEETAGALKVTLTGGDRALIENHRGLLDYNDGEVTAACPGGTVRVRGDGLLLRAMDPDMTDLGAILRSEAGAKFRTYVSRGLDFVDAYTLAAREKLDRLSAERAQNAARARGAGKDHLSATSMRGQGSLSVPAEELALFRELNPGVSDEDIRKYYNADRKRFGG